MLKQLINFCRDEEGSTAIEYGLIASLVSVAAISALTQMTNSVNALYTTVSTSLNTVVANL